MTVNYILILYIHIKTNRKAGKQYTTIFHGSLCSQLEGVIARVNSMVCTCWGQRKKHINGRVYLNRLQMIHLHI